MTTRNSRIARSMIIGGIVCLVLSLVGGCSSSRPAAECAELEELGALQSIAEESSCVTSPTCDYGSAILETTLGDTEEYRTAAESLRESGWSAVDYGPDGQEILANPDYPGLKAHVHEMELIVVVR